MNATFVDSETGESMGRALIEKKGLLFPDWITTRVRLVLDESGTHVEIDKAPVVQPEEPAVPVKGKAVRRKRVAV